MSGRESFGTGLDLTDELDLSVNQSGDLTDATDIDELKKDIAFRVLTSIDVGDYLLLTVGGQEDLRIDVEQAIEADSRVQSASAEITDFVATDDTINVDATVQTENGEFESVITINQ